MKTAFFYLLGLSLSNIKNLFDLKHLSAKNVQNMQCTSMTPVNFSYKLNPA